jgi:hypothetical protein
MRLQTVLHLQPVFEAAQEVVSIRQLAALWLCDKAAIRETAKTHKRVRHAQPIIATAMGKL